MTHQTKIKPWMKLVCGMLKNERIYERTDSRYIIIHKRHNPKAVSNKKIKTFVHQKCIVTGLYVGRKEQEGKHNVLSWSWALRSKKCVGIQWVGHGMNRPRLLTVLLPFKIIFIKHLPIPTIVNNKKKMKTANKLINIINLPIN